MKTGFLYHPVFLQHDTGPGHPECSARLSNTLSYLQQQAWFEHLIPVDIQTADLHWIETIHNNDYIKRAQLTCHAGSPCLDSMDVSVCKDSYEIALTATGSALALADEIMSGNINNGFAMVRPPGHHAERDMALGFCLFNNVAILARYLQQQHGLDKILILDWDVHHGNGTQHSFEEDPSVLYISTHQYPFYPGTGAYTETGIGKGSGATLNCPMAAGADDQDYQSAFTEKILPRIDEFKPEAIIISAGFDAHRDDPLANICLSTEFFAWMSERMMEMADKHSQGKLISVLEGGYNLNTLPHCIGRHLEILSASHQ